MIAASVKKTNCVGITSYQHQSANVTPAEMKNKVYENKNKTKQTLLWNLINALFNHLICPKLVPPTTAKQAHVTPLFHAPTKSPLKRLESAFVANTVKPPKRAQIPTSIVRWVWPKEVLDRKRRSRRRRREKRVYRRKGRRVTAVRSWSGSSWYHVSLRISVQEKYVREDLYRYLLGPLSRPQ